MADAVHLAAGIVYSRVDERRACGGFICQVFAGKSFFGTPGFWPKRADVGLFWCPRGPFWAAANMGSPPLSKDGTGTRGQNGPQCTLKPLLGEFICQVFAEKSIFGTPGFSVKMVDFGVILGPYGPFLGRNLNADYTYVQGRGGVPGLKRVPNHRKTKF